MAGKIKKGDSATKAASATKTGSSAKMRKGDEYLCEICALSLHVDVCGEFLKSKGPVCCGQPMKKKASSAK